MRLNRKLDNRKALVYLDRIRFNRIRSQRSPLRRNQAMTTTAKVLFTGRTHTTSGRDGATRSGDGFVDIKLPQPHPAAENLFASAWSACYLGAIELAAAQRKIKLPTHPSVDTQIDLAREG